MSIILATHWKHTILSESQCSILSLISHNCSLQKYMFNLNIKWYFYRLKPVPMKSRLPHTWIRLFNQVFNNDRNSFAENTLPIKYMMNEKFPRFYIAVAYWEEPNTTYWLKEVSQSFCTFSNLTLIYIYGYRQYYFLQSPLCYTQLKHVLVPLELN